MDKIILSEGIEEFKTIKEDWLNEASKMTVEELPTFVARLINNYEHDYGTICHAMSTAAIATAMAVNNSSQGGITGFQASAVMWEFVRAWKFSKNKTGLRMIDYDNFLYPQYAKDYQKTLSPKLWKNIQEEAAARIEEADKEYIVYIEQLAQYEEDLVAFIQKYPDYHERKEHYERLYIGTVSEWEDEARKSAEGFEFAPSKPYCNVLPDSPVYLHWVSITKGVIPFGYTLEGEEDE